MSKLVSEEEKHITLSITMPRNMIKKIDRTRGFMPRSAWLKTLAVKEITWLNRVAAQSASRTVVEINPLSKGEDLDNG